MMSKRNGHFYSLMSKASIAENHPLLFRILGGVKMFDQLNDSRPLGKKTLKEKVLEGLIIVLALAIMVGIMLFSFHLA